MYNIVNALVQVLYKLINTLITSIFNKKLKRQILNGTNRASGLPRAEQLAVR
jgi:hypothetical protein